MHGVPEKVLDLESGFYHIFSLFIHLNCVATAMVVGQPLLNLKFWSWKFKKTIPKKNILVFYKPQMNMSESQRVGL